MRNYKLGLAIALLTSSALLLAHGGKPWPAPKEAKEKKNPVVATADTLKQAKALYDTNCAMCHGEKGDGKGMAAKALKEKPSNLTNAAMMKEMTDGEIFYKVSEGRMPMPGFKSKLTEEQRWQVVHFVRTFSEKSSAKKDDQKGHKH